MDTQKIEDSLGETLAEGNKREDNPEEFHPSEVTGCPLKVSLNKLMGEETILNCYLFQGSAVHHYLQNTGILDEALFKAGYHPVHTEYEVHTKHKVGDDTWLTGTCDILCDNGDATTIFDIKYSSLRPEYNHGRVMKYFSQTNTYAHMFDADEYGLMLINSQERDNLPENGIVVMEGKPVEDNWEITKKKAIEIHNILKEYGYPDDMDQPLTEEEVRGWATGTWEDFLSGFDLSTIPAYEEECKYCPHSEYCPVKNGDVGGGILGAVNNAKKK